MAAELEEKLIDVAKSVADRYTASKPASYEIEPMKQATEKWTTLFDQAYKAIAKTVLEGRKPLSK